MTATDEVLAWIMAVPEFAGYVPSRGMWVESASLDDKRILALYGEGGGNPGVIERYPRVRVLILGKRGERNVAGAVAELAAHAELLALRTFTEYRAECVAQFRMLGDIVGPGYTTEDRPWLEINLELIT